MVHESDRKAGGWSAEFFAGVLVCAAVLSTLAGCSRDLKINPEAYRGPLLSHAEEGGKHLVIAELPSPGWAVEIDATRQRADGTDVFVTLRRPNPAGVYTQQVVTQRMVTRVDAAEPLGILARVVEYAEESDKAYRRADR